MKKLVLLAAGIAVFFSCQKEEKFEGNWTALLNGQPWEGNQIITIKSNRACADCIDVGLRKYSAEGFLRLGINFEEVPVSVHRWMPSPFQGAVVDTCKGTFSTFTDDGDVGTGFYSVSGTDVSDFFEITEIDFKSKIFKGRFQAAFIRDSFWLIDGIPPDTIRVTQGEFIGVLPD